MNKDLKFCPKCGTELEIGASYCPSCGADLKERKKVIQTIKPEVVSTDVKYAEFAPRAIAWLIDIIIINIASTPLAYFLGLVNFWFATSFYNFLIGFCYFWLLEAFNKGQTIGKLALKLRTVDENSLEITTPAQYAINNISKATGFLLLDVIIGILINSSAEEPARKRLRLTQNLARTAVIAEK
ncbi:MAG: RDD family protein [Candidatus Thorarchaeota archaeon]